MDRRIASALVIVAMIAIHPSIAKADWLLTWTNPSQLALVVDTTLFSCSGGPSLTDLDSIYVHVVPVSGGSERIWTTLPRRGHENTPDSLRMPDSLAGHFYLTSTRVGASDRQSCPSNVIYHGPIASVPLPVSPSYDPITHCSIVDIRGRLVVGPPARHGRYFRILTHRSGRRTVVPFWASPSATQNGPPRLPPTPSR